MASHLIARLSGRTVAIALLTVALLMVAIGGVMKLTVDRLLYWDATSSAESWARTVIANVRDVADISRGAVPSTQSMRFLVATHRVRNVFAFQITDLGGRIELVSDGAGIVDVASGQREPLAAEAAASGRTVVQLSYGTPPLRPRVYSVAYVPLVIGGRSRAVVAAYIDLSEKYDHFRSQFAVAAVLLCLVTGLAMGIPLAAWLRQRRAKERADRHIAYLYGHDPLTELANRHTLGGLLDRYLRRDLPVAVHHVDLDRFKAINDTYGYACGDLLIKETADRLRARARPGDVVARLGADEFAVLQLDADAEAAAAFASKLIEALAQPLTVNGQDIATTASIGCAIAPRDGATAERLLKCANLARDKSKHDGRNTARFFAAELDSALESRLQLERRLREAVRHHLFELHFQPVYRVRDHRLCGFEALLRLRDVHSQMISPALFVPVAEEIGLIHEIGAWVIREACRNAAQWPDPLWVAVNVSPAQFQTGSVSDALTAALAATGLAPARIEIEVTETALLGDTPRIAGELQRIKAAGVAVVMDDFGTGYSSMSYLWRFPFDKIKVDRSFMEGFAARSPNIETIIRTIVAMGHSLAMRINVEGIETERQAAFVDKLGCDEMQGFLFSRPLPAQEVAMTILTDQLRARPTRPALHIASRNDPDSAVSAAG